METTSTMAAELAANIRGKMSHHKFVEARLQVTYELNEDAHGALLWLYCDEDDQPSGNIFRGDAHDLELEVATSRYRGKNKQFIKALVEALPLDWCYLSELTGNTAFDRPGASDVCARFPFDDLLGAISSLECVSPEEIEEPQDSSATLSVRIEEFRDVLQAYYDSLHEDDDMTIFFASDIDEDESGIGNGDYGSDEDNDYVYTQHRVLGFDCELIADMEEDVFEAIHDGHFVGDIETQMFETTIDSWLDNNGGTIRI